MALSLYGLISSAERDFIINGVNDNMRTDGRTINDFRVIEMETNCIETTNGSARVRIGSTELLVGVKAELEKASLADGDAGRIEFSVDCSPNATPMFEGRRGGEDIEAEIASLFSRFYKAEEFMDRKKLTVVPNAWCWVLYVDILILEVGGNLVDASSIAVKAALRDTRLPLLNIEKGDEDEYDIQVSDDPLDGEELDVHPPLTVTVAKLGHRYIVDPTDEEEAVTLANLIVSVNENGEARGMKQTGKGSLDPSSILEMISIAKKAAKTLHRSVNRALLAAEDEDIRRL